MAITTLFLVFGVLVLVFILLMQIMALKKNEDNEADFQKLNQKLESKINELSENYAKESRQNREEMAKNIQTVNQTIHSQINDQGMGQLKQIADLSRKNEEALERLRLTMDTKLESMRTNNEEKLDAMRKTVDEKLETTLNKRLGESFNLVNQRLEQVHKSLGEMQSLSTNLTDIKKIFTNVKSRGVWGEVQLGNILEEILAPNQYIANFAPKPKSDERVEFAVCLPGRDGEQGEVYLPIDSKFPAEDYQRLIEAQDNADVAAVDASRKALENALKKSAKSIHDKYINPPKTLEYAVLFLPTEGLFAEALRLPGFMEYAQEQCQIMVAGPTNLAALLNSIKLGFRTLAIQEKSGEIRKLLGAIKTDMNKFELALEKIQKKISEADKTLADATDRTRIISKKLNKVEAISTEETAELLDE
ncbi:MAG: DNA recombination protein RmuC [Clostridiales bacterium]